MPTVIRQLSGEEFAAWDKFVASSPQASLFHTAAWNQMLYETAPQGQEWELLVCEKKGVFLGGIALHSWHLGQTTHAPAPLFGYNGPILTAEVNYQEQYKTVPGYEIILELLKHVVGLITHSTIRNQPEIWDVRAYADTDWKIETQYTHILPCPNSEGIWNKFDPILQERINADQFSIHTEFTDTQVRKLRLHQAPQESHMEVLTKRIHWMQERGLCRLVTLVDKRGKELAIAFFILSKENRTIYLCKIIPMVKKLESEILPSLIWQSYLAFGDGFEYIDLGVSDGMSVSKTKDHLGCSLAPFFITTHSKT